METLATKYERAACFAAVVQAGSFTAAAAQLGCSKAQASKLVRSLEQALGVQLLLRTTRRLALTEAGREYLRYCDTLRETLAEGERVVSALAREVSGTLRVTAPTTFGEAFLVDLLLAVQRRHPRLDVTLDLSVQHRDLSADAFDFAFRAALSPDDRLVSQALAEGPEAIVASPRYLREQRAVREPQDLAGLSCLLNAHVRDNAQWSFRRDGETTSVRVTGRFAANHFGALRDAAIAGAGVARLPGYLVAAAVERGSLVRLLPEYDAGRVPLCLVYPHRRHTPHRNRVFREFVVDWFADPVRARIFR